MALADRFNHSAFGRFINSPGGRVFRLTAGVGFAVAGMLVGRSAAGVGLALWALAPLSAGAFDVCWVSAALGGPLRGGDIRSGQASPSGTTPLRAT